MQPTALPLSLTDGVAAAHLADLRAEAERHRLVRAAAPCRRSRWSATVAAALRDSLAGALPSGRDRSRTAPCPTC